MKKKLILLFSLLLCLSSINITFADTDINGSLVIVGGALRSDNDAVYEKFIELAGGAENARIGIVPAASGSPHKYSQMFFDDMVTRGVLPENVIVLPLAVINDKRSENVDESDWAENGNNPDVANSIENLTGIWFVGGDQTRITDVLLNEDQSASLVLEAIWKIYKNGAVVGGTSAGAAIMSDIMIAGGDSLGALANGFVSEYDDSTLDYQNQGGLIVSKGLGFFKYGVIDQHFDRKARLGRLAVVTQATQKVYPVSFGVEENTAMIFDNVTKTVSVIGTGGVFVVDASDSSKASSISSYENIKVSYIEGYDTYNVSTNEFTMDENKYTTVGYEYLATENPDTTGSLSANQKLNQFISYGLVDNALRNEIKTYLYGLDGKGFAFTFKNVDDTEGYWGQSGAADVYSFKSVRMDIEPIKVEIQTILED